MTPLPIGQRGVSAASLEASLDELEARWTAETAHLSSTSAITKHPAFREIVDAGVAALPWLLRKAAQQPSLLVWALPSITGEDPVPQEDRGRIGKMTEAWLKWGRDHGYGT
jgi:hypothetical protein